MTKMMQYTCYFLKLTSSCLVLMLSGCGKQQKTIDEMSFVELQEQATQALTSKKDERAITYLERMVSQFPEHQNISDYKLKLADLYLDSGRLDSAYELYKNFTNRYPADKRAEYAIYKRILAKFYVTLKIDHHCDASDTTKALDLCKKYLGNKNFTAYRDDVCDIEKTCNTRLFDKEIHVCNAYIRRGDYKSAHARLEQIKEKFLTQDPFHEPHILFLECKIAHKEKNNEVAQSFAKDLVDKFPESSYTQMAEGIVHKKKEFLF